jgi:RNA polymerase sigma-70 factor (ECF subfamily)
MVGSFIEGEDVVQEAMVKALAALEAGQLVDHLEGWIFGIAHNAAMDHLRSVRRRGAAVEGEALMQLEDPQADAEMRYASALGIRAFVALPPAQRASVILMDVLGYDLAEIGEVLGTTVAATKANLHRGRTALKAMASERDIPRRVTLDDGRMRLTQRYVDLFNARDFDAIRDMLAEDVRLELVAKSRMKGAQALRYFSNYESIDGWRLFAGLIEDRPAIFVSLPGHREPDYIVLLDWRDGRLSAIRDFRYARYSLDGADIHIFR